VTEEMERPQAWRPVGKRVIYEKEEGSGVER
jgi:hypothetical protein